MTRSFPNSRAFQLHRLALRAVGGWRPAGFPAVRRNSRRFPVVPGPACDLAVPGAYSSCRKGLEGAGTDGEAALLQIVQEAASEGATGKPG